MPGDNGKLDVSRPMRIAAGQSSGFHPKAFWYTDARHAQVVHADADAPGIHRVEEAVAVNRTARRVDANRVQVVGVAGVASGDAGAVIGRSAKASS